MFCPECGTNLGNPAPTTPVRCPSCGRVVSPGAPATGQVSGQTAGTGQYGQGNGPFTYGQQPLGMKWYKFVIWFQLFAGALTGLATGIATITGATYGEYADLVYMLYDGLKVIDVLYGVTLIALAAGYLYVRQELARFKAGAPYHYIQLLVAVTVLPIVYLLAATVVTGIDLDELLGVSMIAGILANVTLAIVSKYYFDRRASLFVN